MTIDQPYFSFLLGDIGGAFGVAGWESCIKYEKTATSSLGILGKKLGIRNLPILWMFPLMLPSDKPFIYSTTQHSGAPLKIRRLAHDPERFIWAVSMAQSRCINMQMRIGALVQDANMIVPYAGMLLSQCL